MRASFTIAWREISRHIIRTLISVMIVAIPVALVSFVAAQTWATQRPVSDPALQAIVQAPESTPIIQDPSGSYPYWGHSSSADPMEFSESNKALTTTTLEKIVSGNTVVSVLDTQGFTLLGSSAHNITIRQLDAQAAPGYLGLVQGTAPTTGEIALSGETAHLMGMDIGDEFDATIQNTSVHLKVSGITSKFESFVGKDTVTLSHSAFPEGAAVTEYWLVVGSEPVTWDHVKEINKHGSLVTSTWVKDHPPAVQDRYNDHEENLPSTIDVLEMSIIGVVAIILVTIVLILMITPVFTISANRMRQSLGNILMNGGESKHIRVIVLVHGSIIGLFGGIVGAIGGFTTLVVTSGTYLLHVPWTIAIVLSVAIIGLILGLLAAIIPAIQASRLTPIEAAKARSARSTSSPSHPTRSKIYTWIFLGLFILGVGIMLGVSFAQRSNLNIFAFAALAYPIGLLLEVIGAIGLVPAIISVISTKLHLNPIATITTRDLLRSSHRTVPAVGAIVGVMIGVTMILSFLSFTRITDDDLTHSGYPLGSLNIQTMRYGTPSTVTDTAVEQATAEYIHAFGHATINNTYDHYQKDPNFGIAIPASFANTPAEEPCYTFSGEILAKDADNSSGGIQPSPMEETTCGSPKETSTPTANPYNVMWSPVTINIVDDLPSTLTYYGIQQKDAGHVREVWESGGVIFGSSASNSEFKENTSIEDIPLLALEWVSNDDQELSTSSEGESPKTPTLEAQRLINTPITTITSSRMLTDRILVPLATAQEWGLTPTLAERTLIFNEPLQPTDSFAVSKIAHKYDSVLSIWAYQRSFFEEYSLHITVFILLIGLFAFTVFVMAMTSTDMRADYATLFAVGAEPRTLSSMSMIQGLIMGVIGVIVGIPAGMLPIGILLIASPGAIGFPWLWLGAIALLVPCVTALAAALTRPRDLELTQRFE